MSDNRFNDRLKRIKKSHRGGPKAEIIAGVGSVSKAKRQAGRVPMPWITMIFGAAAGYGALHVLHTRLGLDGARALLEAPEQAVPLATGDLMLGSAGVGAALITLLFLYALTKGYKAPRLHAFAFAAVAGAMGAAAAVLYQPDFIAGLVSQYLPV